jgi:PAS domain S-box-containing protein
VQKYLQFIFGLFVAVCVTLSAFGYYQSAILDGVRAFVRGEGLYAKGQISAVHNLHLYLLTGQQEYLQNAKDHLAVPVGDALARKALQQDDPDYATARKGFLQALNHPDDVEQMIWFFDNFQHFPYVSDAISIWEKADDRIAELQSLINLLGTFDPTSDENRASRLIARVDYLNEELNKLEIDFSLVLSEGARWVKQLLVWIGVGIAVLILLAAWWGTRRIFSWIDHRNKEIIKTQEKIRQSEERFDLAMQAANDGLWDWNLIDHSIYYSPRLKQMLGYTDAEMPNDRSAWEDMVDDEGRAVALKTLYECLKGERNAFEMEFKIRNKNGEMLDILSRGTPVRNRDGMVTRLVGTFSDITQSKQDRAALRRLNKSLNQQVVEQTKDLRDAKDAAEAANRSKSAFLANMSHEIRTPMNGVMGMIELLARTNLTDDQRKILHTIDKSSTSLLRIIDDILDVSKIEAGKLGLIEETVNVQLLCEGVLQTLRPIAIERKVHVKLNLDSHPRFILADAVRLRQILTNLLNNAIKFSDKTATKRQGDVKLIVDSQSKGTLRFIVTDNGIGMPDAIREKLFRPFMQAEESSTRNFGGTGLGLSICRALVDMMDGKISVESTPGQGSSFTVEIPITEVEPAWNYKAFPGLHVYGVITSDSCAMVTQRYLGSFGVTHDFFVSVAELRTQLSHVKDDKDTVVLLGLSTDEETNDQHDQLKREFPDYKFLVLRQEFIIDATPLGANSFSVYRYPLLPSELETALESLDGNPHPTQATPETIVTDTEQDKTQPKVSILLVEDNQVNQMVMKAQMDTLGFEVDIADNGQLGLNKWSIGQYDLVVTDCQMPVMDGYQMTRRIRELEAERGSPRTPIIAVTADAGIVAKEECIAAGMDDTLVKPVKIPTMQACFNDWLKRDQSDNS